jgi:hypothetical protein
MWGVSIGVGLVALAFAILIATVGRQKFPRLAIALMLTAVAGLVAGSFGPALHHGVTAADSYASASIGRWTGTAVTGFLALVVIGVWGFLVYHGQLDLRTLGLTAAVPLFVNLVPGIFGTIAIFVIGIVPEVVGGLLSWGLYGHWGG